MRAKSMISELREAHNLKMQHQGLHPSKDGLGVRTKESPSGVWMVRSNPEIEHHGVGMLEIDKSKEFVGFNPATAH